MNRKRKKLIHILNELLPSGAEVMLYNSAELWKGYDKYILASSEELGSYAVELEKTGYKIAHIHNTSVVKKYMETYRYLHKEKFDVVHIHREGESYVYAFIARISNIKARIVKTVHNVFRFHGKLHFIRIMTRFSERILGVKYVAIGKSVYENEKTHLKNICVIIDNWYDESRFRFVKYREHQEARQKLGINEEIFAIMSVGNCNTIKNHELLLLALKKLNERGIRNWIYYHIGEGDLTNAEIKLCKTYSLENQTKFLGRILPDEYLQACNLYIMPSLQEGVSIAAIEAMKSGIPVLFSEVPGLVDFKILEKQNNEIHFFELRLDDLVEKLMNLCNRFEHGKLNNNEEQSKLIQEKYNRAKSVQKYIDLYEGRSI